MARSSRGGRTGGRSSQSSSSSSQTVILVGGLAVVVLILVFMLSGRGTSATTPSGGGGSSASGTNTGKTPPAAAAPAAPVSLPSARSGKTPAEAAPALTQETLGRLNEVYNRAKAVYNESVTARTAGDNALARQKAEEAKGILDQWLKLVEPQLAWQEKAQLDDWSQPAEYVLLEQLYGNFQTLNKRVRMAGG